jgi:hypothetical protein
MSRPFESVRGTLDRIREESAVWNWGRLSTAITHAVRLKEV